MKVPKKNDYLARQKARDRVPQDATQRTISLRLSSGMTGCRRSSMEKSQGNRKPTEIVKILL